VIKALEAGLEASPDDSALRLQLARILLDGGEAERALAEYGRVLAVDPVDEDALRGAHAAALANGDDSRAVAYARILTSLGAEMSSEPSTPPSTRAANEPDAPVAPRPTMNVMSDDDDSMQSSNDLDPGDDDDDDVPRLRVLDGGQAFVPDVESAKGETLDAVAGLDDVKRRLELSFLGPIRNPQLSRVYGKRMRGGLLLYGPPGCGKTYIARCLAGELNANFISVGLTDILDMYIGESEKNLHHIFATARESAPTVLFFDELDALGQRRATRSSWTREIVNQFLVEMDGIGSGDEAVFVLGATNLPWDVDGALRRPGRFDRTVFVPPPDLEGRKRIVEMELAERPTHKVDAHKIASKTDGFSGADVAYLCELATELALERAMQTGEVTPITRKHIDRAISEMHSSTGSWFETARNYALFADASGEYDELVAYMKAHRRL
jgi:AAA+ superfamily predicted ATPase